MAKTKISEFNSNPALNTDIDSINISEGCAPSGINDAIRELMAQLKDWQSGTSNDPMVVGSSGSLTLNQGTANGVLYLNGSKVATSGTALQFDGTNFGVGTGGNTLNQQSVVYKTGANAVYQQIANGSTGLGATNGIRIGLSSAGLGEIYSSSSTPTLTFDSSGNLGLGVTPSAWNSGYKAFEGSWGALSFDNAYSGGTVLSANAYIGTSSSTDWRYKQTAAATRYYQRDGKHEWYNAASGTAGNAITFTQAMTLDASGKLGVGTTTPDSYSWGAGIGINGSSYSAFTLKVGDSGKGYVAAGSSAMYIGGTNPLLFFTGGTGSGNEVMRLDSSGNLGIGAASGGARLWVQSGSNTEGTELSRNTSANTNNTYVAYVVQAEGFNAAATALKVGKNSSTSRSINAGGTVNASGADYAEYMTKSGNFNVAKGDVVGIDAQGKLTNVFANAISFVVKSTDPSYVGGDTWGVGFDDDAEGLEAARQTVDRIAFAGQVPVNVLGASAGQYIIPVNDNGSIKGQAVSNPTFEQYQSSVGKVIAIEADGRARIIVKVA